MTITSPITKKTAILVSLGLSSFSSANITNNIKGLYDIDKLPGGPKPVLCVKQSEINWVKWAYGKSLDPFVISGMPTYFGAALRLNDCSESDIYLGWFNVSKIGAEYQIGYTPLKDAHIVMNNFSINNDTFNGQLGFTPIQRPNTFPVNHQLTENWYTGYNLSGLEFSTSPNNSVIPDLSSQGADYEDTVALLAQGANTIRLPIRWEYLQPYEKEDANSISNTLAFQVYFSNLVLPLLQTLTEKKYHVILDLHSYMHYSQVGTEVAGCYGDGKCPDGKLITDPKPYVGIWSKLYQAISASGLDEKYLMFDLVNEPATTEDETLTAQQAFDMQVEVIKAIDNLGFTSKYLVEGVHWSGLHSWQQAGNAEIFTRKNLLASGLSESLIDQQLIINVHQYLDSNYSGTHDQCQQNIMTTGTDGFNLDQFTDYLKENQFKAIVTETGVGHNQQSCSKPFSDFLSYLRTHAYTSEKQYGFVGWTIWSTGHGWGNYNLRVKPHDWKDAIIEKFLVN